MSGDPTLGLLIGVGGGLFSFFRGFKVYREFRVIEDTPQMPIRSIPMGLVNVHGKALGEEQILSPVTHSPCYFYKVDIEKWKQEQRSSGWHHYRTDMDGVKFYLEDPSGKVLVDARGAELDLTKLCQHEVSDPRTSSFQSGAATDGELLQYVNRAALTGFSSFIGRRIAGLSPQSDPEKEDARQRIAAVLQHPIRGGSQLSPELTSFVSTVIEKRLAAQGASNDPAKEHAKEAMLAAFKHPIGSPEFMQQARAAFSQSAHSPEEEQKFNEWAAKVGEKQAQAGIAFSPASGRYRFTEYCIVPGQDYTVTGSCVENPVPKDVQDRNCIIKGINEPTFLISDKGIRSVESGLRNSAALMVFGGGAVAVICLGLVLLRFGLFK